MEKTRTAWLAMALMVGLAACGTASATEKRYGDGVYRDLASGYNDDVIVTVTVKDGSITDLEANNRNGNESEYFRKAEEGLRGAILEKQGVDGVDAVSGATGTSESILTAMKGILEQATGREETGNGMNGAAPGQPSGSGNGGEGTIRPAMTPRPTVDPAKAEVFAGLGGTANFRAGPGKDAQGVQVYSFNVTMASALFDKEGRILHVRADVYEVATPNYDGATMPHFSGWPGKEGYNVTDTSTGQVTGVSENTEESLEKEIAAWRTKRERGDQYGMNKQNDWYRQMDAYQQWMIGKTTAELRTWYDRFTNQNGRPIKESSDSPEDRQALERLTEAERGELADVVSMATMSLSDSHGLILEAIEKAYENRTPVEGAAVNANLR